MQAAQLSVGLDVGGTKTAALLVDPNGCVLGQATVPTHTVTPDELLATITRAIHAVPAEANATPQQIHNIGLGVPGQVDSTTGIVKLAVNLNLQAYPLGPTISARFKAPTFLENDVRTAAIGAFDYVRQTESVQSIAYVLPFTAGAFLTMIIPLIVFFSLQRYFVRGLLAGSVKG